MTDDKVEADTIGGPTPTSSNRRLDDRKKRDPFSSIDADKNGDDDDETVVRKDNLDKDNIIVACWWQQ